MLETGKTHFWSRSREKLWMKGETSGHVQDIVSMQLDCDGDTPAGPGQADRGRLPPGAPVLLRGGALRRHRTGPWPSSPSCSGSSRTASTTPRRGATPTSCCQRGQEAEEGGGGGGRDRPGGQGQGHAGRRPGRWPTSSTTYMVVLEAEDMSLEEVYQDAGGEEEVRCA